MTETSGEHAFLFPGQGAQKRGMGQELYNHSEVAQEVFARADEAAVKLNLGYSIKEVCFEDPHNQLEGDQADTSVIQPALLTVCVATAKHLGLFLPPAKIYLGHSAGKYSALVASEAMDFEEAIYYVSQRGVVMKEARDDLGAVVGIVKGLSGSAIQETLAESKHRLGLPEDEPFFALNVENSEVISMIVGQQKHWNEAVNALKQAGAKIVDEYKGAPPSHWSKLITAQERLNKLGVKVSVPKIPILDDLSNNVMRSIKDLETSMSIHLIAPIFWKANIYWLKENGYSEAYEIGPGTILKGMARRQYPELVIHSTNSLEEIRKTEETHLSGQ